MPAKVLKSTANVTFIQSKLIQDVQIVIDNRELYNSSTRKTGTTWDQDPDHLACFRHSRSE